MEGAKKFMKSDYSQKIFWKFLFAHHQVVVCKKKFPPQKRWKISWIFNLAQVLLRLAHELRFTIFVTQEFHICFLGYL